MQRFRQISYTFSLPHPYTKILQNFKNEFLLTFFIKLSSGTLPTLHNKRIRYPSTYVQFTCLYCRTATNIQDHWSWCPHMKLIWLTVLHWPLLRLMIHIKLKVDIQADFQDLLFTYDNLPPTDFTALISNLLHGFIFISDIQAIDDRIRLTSKTLKWFNLGVKFLYYFIQSVRWPSHCKRIIAWEISHNINNKSLRKKITLRKGANQRTGNINITPSSH